MYVCMYEIYGHYDAKQIRTLRCAFDTSVYAYVLIYACMCMYVCIFIYEVYGYYNAEQLWTVRERERKCVCVCLSLSLSLCVYG